MMNAAPRERQLGYMSGTVVFVAGVTHRQLDYWTTKGTIEASGQAASGHGSMRLYLDRDIFKVKILKQLSVYSRSLEQSRDILSLCDAFDYREDSRELWVLRSDGKVCVCPTRVDLHKFIGDNGSTVIVVPAGYLWREVCNSLANLPPSAANVIVDTV